MKKYAGTFLLVAGIALGAFASSSAQRLQIEPERLSIEVVKKVPHDRSAFTQGLLLHDGKLYESTGLRGESSLRRVDPETGTVEALVKVSDAYFAEGLALAGNRLVQITWQENTAFVYDRETLEQIDQFEYEGEGWGITFDGGRLIMSDGSDRLTFRDPITFEVLGGVSVTIGDKPLRNLNELEFVEGFVYANVWTTSSIVKIDPRDGVVVAVIDVPKLLSPEESIGTDVLNGIAWDPATGNFLITGKKWPALYEVRFVPGVTSE